MGKLVEQGLQSFKFFMAYKGKLQVSDELLAHAFRRCRQLGAIPLVRFSIPCSFHTVPFLLSTEEAGPALVAIPLVRSPIPCYYSHSYFYRRSLTCSECFSPGALPVPCFSYTVSFSQKKLDLLWLPFPWCALQPPVLSTQSTSRLITEAAASARLGTLRRLVCTS